MKSLKRSQSETNLGFFELLPYELVELITCFIPDVDYNFSMNLINQFWNLVISQRISQSDIKIKYEKYDLNKVFCSYKKYEAYDILANCRLGVVLMDTLFLDRNNFDVIPTHRRIAEVFRNALGRD